MDIDILIPVLNRPDRVEPLLESLYSSQRILQFRVLFLASPDDDAEAAALSTCGEDVLTMFIGAGPGDYARKMNTGVKHTTCPWIFFGADDLCFCPAWADIAVETALKAGARVVGTNDLGNPTTVRGRHSTHTLFHRSYVEQGTIDNPDLVIHEGYEHNFVDNEFIETAMKRHEFVHATQSYVEHLHPNWGKAEPDATYELGMKGFTRDRKLYVKRKQLWR